MQVYAYSTGHNGETGDQDTRKYGGRMILGDKKSYGTHVMKVRLTPHCITKTGVGGIYSDGHARKAK